MKGSFFKRNVKGSLNGIIFKLYKILSIVKGNLEEYIRPYIKSYSSLVKTKCYYYTKQVQNEKLDPLTARHACLIRSVDETASSSWHNNRVQ